MKNFIIQNSKILFFALILSFSSFMLSYSFGTPTGSLLDIFVRKDGVTTDSQTVGGNLTVQNKIYSSPTLSSDAESSVATKSYVDVVGNSSKISLNTVSIKCYNPYNVGCEVSCPSNYRIVSGGCVTPYPFYLSESRPMMENGWYCGAQDPVLNNFWIPIDAYAICTP